MSDISSAKKTPLFNQHQQRGGKIVDFAGWALPVQFKGLIEEHNAVRKNIGLFDVSHMGEIVLTGPEAEKALNYLTSNDVSKLYDGKGHYGAILNQTGGVVDDIIVYKKAANDFFICVNASNTDKDFAWFQKNNKFDAEFKNVSNSYGQIAIQGPNVAQAFSRINELKKVNELKYFHFMNGEFKGVPIIFARTGYTGEDGFELFIPAECTEIVWNALCDIEGATLCGLGARDTLRLEACYPLHGHELGDDISALESKIGWVVKFDKGDFIGREALLKEKSDSKNIKRTLVGLMAEDNGVFRHGDKVQSIDGKNIGIVTSGTKTPTVNKSLGLALIESQFSNLGTILTVEVRGRFIKCQVAKIPFYKKP